MPLFISFCVFSAFAPRRAIYYLNEGWQQPHGGELRIYPPHAQAAASDAEGAAAICDIAPLADRLVLFFADFRVPHEVLPTYAVRLAVTLWYFDKEEHAQALARSKVTSSQPARDAEEAMRRLQETFGRRPESQ